MDGIKARLEAQVKRLEDLEFKVLTGLPRVHVISEMKELGSELRALAAEAGWISVEDRLPEEGQWVLVIWRSGTSDKYKHMDVARYWHEPKRWSSEITRTIQVTHWQSLPPPPKPEAERAEG